VLLTSLDDEGRVVVETVPLKEDGPAWELTLPEYLRWTDGLLPSEEGVGLLLRPERRFVVVRSAAGRPEPVLDLADSCSPYHAYPDAEQRHRNPTAGGRFRPGP